MDQKQSRRGVALWLLFAATQANAGENSVVIGSTSALTSESRFTSVSQWSGNLNITGAGTGTSPGWTTGSVEQYSITFTTNSAGTLSAIQSYPQEAGRWAGTWSGGATIKCDVLTTYPDGSKVRITSDAAPSVTHPLTLFIEDPESGLRIFGLEDMFGGTPGVATRTYYPPNGGQPEQSPTDGSFSTTGQFASSRISGTPPESGYTLQAHSAFRRSASSICGNSGEINWTADLILSPTGGQFCGNLLYSPEIQCCVESTVQQKFPILDLDKCPDIIQRTQPISNGCGNDTYRFPDHLGPLSWRSICDDHDVCYGTCGSSKLVCDGIFSAKTAAVCGVVTDQPLAAALCGLVSLGGFQIAFRETSTDSWVKGQKENCQCCN
jgi:hypothetical protein